jgi:hypothetical protein
MRKRFLKRSFYQFGILALFLALGITQVHASGLKNLSLEEITAATDVIAVGTVAKKQSQWVGNHIETTIGIKAKEYWKGDLGQSFEIAQMGGEVTQPLPIAMESNGAPKFFEGERVVLFLQKPSQAPQGKGASQPDPKSKVPGSYKVVGWAQGKYTILPDPKTGEDRVVRLGMENMQILDKRDMDKRIAAAQAYANSRLEKEGKMNKSAPSREPSPLDGKGNQKMPSAKSSPAPTGEMKGKASHASENSRDMLDLQNRDKLNDLKSKVQSYLK